MRIELRYGAGTLPLEVKQRYPVEIIRPQTIVEHPAVLQEVERSIETPEHSESLRQLTMQAGTIAVVMNNEQDFALNSRLLKSLLDILSTSINDPEAIRIFYSWGDKNEVSKHEVDVSLGKPTSKGHQLILHDSRDSESLCFIGDTSTHSTPVYVNKAFAEADLRVGVGTIRCDGFIGATGGRMSVIPHVCGIKTITRNSKLRIQYPAGPFMIDSAVCVDMEEIADIAGLDFIINLIPDSENNVASIVAGSHEHAWRRGIDICRTVTEVQIHQRADIAVVSTGVECFDDTLFSATDSLIAAYEASVHGGSILLMAECSKGVGPPGFLKGISDCASASEVVLLAESSYELGMEKAHLFWKILSSRNLIICSRLRASLVSERLHCHAVRDPQDGFELAKRQMVSSPRVAVIPKGTRTLPVSKTT